MSNIGYEDQLAAASKETNKFFSKIEEQLVRENRLMLKGGVESFGIELFVKLLKQCQPCPCLQANLSPQPMYCCLALRTICCSRCMDAVALILQVIDQDQNCDICGKPEPSGMFSEFAIHWNNIAMFGNRGLCCIARTTP